MKITSITNLQIVNGGQTTASVATCDRDDHAAHLDQTFVPMKLSIVADDQFSALMKDISLYANSQNKVSDADLASNDPFQIRFEEMSRRILAPAVKGLQYNTRWYYERARGQYANEFYKMTAKQRDSRKLIFPKSQLVTKQDLARVVLSWDQQPHVVALGAQRMILEFARIIKATWEKDRDSFNDQYFKDRISELIIYRQFDQQISKQSWYVVGYKAIIAAYTLAWFALYLQKQKLYLDLELVWRNQMASEELVVTLLTVGNALFAEMFTPRDGRIPNVTQLAKRQSLWADLKELSIPVSLIGIPVVSRSERSATLSTAKVTRVIDNGIEAQKSVIASGAVYWKNLLHWLDMRGSVEPHDRAALGVASDSTRVPSEKQAIRLLALAEQARSIGFLEQSP